MLDAFPYSASVQQGYPAYRSLCSAAATLVALAACSLRIYQSIAQYSEASNIVTESYQLYPRDSSDHLRMVRIGLQLRREGWKPLEDPRYVSFRFEQGFISRTGNVSYVDLGSLDCSFVDRTGRLIADRVRCPLEGKGVLQGDVQDEEFRFLRARLLRCDNGTDDEGRALPGMCMPAEEIDHAVWGGVLYLFEQETDIGPDEPFPFMRLQQWRREFVSGTHISADVFLAERYVTSEPRYLFDEKPAQRYLRVHEYAETFTDFEEETREYAAFYFRRASGHLAQYRSRPSLFAMFEIWGGLGAFMLFFVGSTVWRLNRFFFWRQLVGLDLRSLTRDQFSQHARLVHETFQMPQEFRELHEPFSLVNMEDDKDAHRAQSQGQRR